MSKGSGITRTTRPKANVGMQSYSYKEGYDSILNVNSFLESRKGISRKKKWLTRRLLEIL